MSLSWIVILAAVLGIFSIGSMVRDTTKRIENSVRLAKEDILRSTEYLRVLGELTTRDKTAAPNPTFFRSVSEQEKAERILSVLMTPEERKEPYIPTADQMVELRQTVAQKYGLPPFEVGFAAE